MATIDAAPTPETQLPPKKCPWVNKPAPNHDPLPNWACNNHPRAIAAPCHKCTSAEVQVAKKELEALKAQK